ncbi:MAG: helix-turn-helix domain-containing protein [Candidatus Eremiobacteraeota bacterium]|nr:helix-turn-helix domain-containing protein [Candidatus Eremiobacteraeota bacterium]
MRESQAGGSRTVSALLHPIRIRIVSMLESRSCTAGEIARAIPDLPTATLYRHLNRLKEAEILTVQNPVSGRPGPAERVYAINRSAVLLSKKEVGALSRSALRHYFATFVTSILGDFERYTNDRSYDLAADGIRFLKTPLRLTSAEHSRFLTEIQRVVTRYEAKANVKGRVRFFTHLSVPAPRQMEQ